MNIFSFISVVCIDTFFNVGPMGLTKGDPGAPDSHGFCLLNNISIGAAYALNVHRRVIKRVAIVDFDVHNGNGTAETGRKEICFISNNSNQN